MRQKTSTATPFQTAIDVVEALPPEDQETLIDLIHRRLTERRRDEIARHAAETLHAVRQGRAQMASILEGKADLVLGARPRIARPSERFLNWLTSFRVKVSDSGTGFRALRRRLALKLELDGRCICGISVLEPAALGARVAEVPIELNEIDKPRRIAWFHVPQVWYVLRWLVH